MAEIANLMVSGDEYQQDSKTYKKGDKKWVYRVTGYIPYYRSIRVWEDPYTAAKNYEYGKATYK